MASEYLHAPRDRLTTTTITNHQAIASLMEELEAADWYRQRADDCEDEALKSILLHHMREEIEHASMLIEWLRRNDPIWAAQLSTYLYSEAPITEVEEKETGGNGHAAAAANADKAPLRVPRRFTIGPLKG